MCDACGCGITGAVTIDARPVAASHTDHAVLTRLLADNATPADHNRERLDDHHVLAINLMSAPGSGKTALLEATIDALRDEFRIGVIEGDLETGKDAIRIRAHGV